MNTKLLMTSSALFLGSIGLLLSFLYDEIAIYLNINKGVYPLLILKVLGSLFMSFGILNWMAKGTLIGGIYNRPIVLGNLMHFGVTAIILIKLLFVVDTNIEILIVFSIIYTFFALSFIYVFRINPSSIKS